MSFHLVSDRRQGRVVVGCLPSLPLPASEHSKFESIMSNKPNASRNLPSKEGASKSGVAEGGKHHFKGLDARFGAGKEGVDAQKGQKAAGVFGRTPYTAPPVPCHSGYNNLQVQGTIGKVMTPPKSISKATASSPNGRVAGYVYEPRKDGARAENLESSRGASSLNKQFGAVVGLRLVLTIPRCLDVGQEVTPHRLLTK
ncbi:hypothetical protein DFH09DRAFT_1305030 [Mycena vulgaris]|nr:hypothetical protein DFH09DRAFT_1305030 [Mycena vulgaris]